MNPRPLGPEPSALPSALHPDKGYDGVERSAHIMSAANNKVLKQSFRFLHPDKGYDGVERNHKLRLTSVSPECFQHAILYTQLCKVSSVKYLLLYNPFT